MDQKRLYWIDYARFIGITLVVCGHVSRGIFNAGITMDAASFGLVDNFIYAFHMPLFFFLSGLFFIGSIERRGSKNFLTSKVDTIIYPYIVWSLIQGLLEAVLSKYTNSSVSLGEVLSLLWQPRAHFWFLYALFFMTLSSSILFAFTKRTYPILILAIIIYYSVRYTHGGIVTSFSRNFVYFAVGIVAASHISTLSKKINTLPWVISTVALFIGIEWFFGVKQGYVYDAAPYIIQLVVALAGIIGVISLSSYLGEFKEIKFASYLGQHSMEIYLMHVLAGSFARIILSKFLGIHDATIHLFIGVSVAMLGPICALWLINRFNLLFLLKPPKRLSAENF